MAGSFKVLQWTIDAARREVVFSFDCASFGPFEEVVTFPVDLPQTDETKALLGFAAPLLGLSYYKAAASARVEIEYALPKEALAASQALYTQGLGEFYVRNDIFPHDVEVVALEKDSVAATAPLSKAQDLDTNPVLAFGGGKDSHVSAEVLSAIGLSPEFVSVVLSETVAQKLASMSYEPITFLRRTLDPKLIALASTGAAKNGHIPITAINSVLLALYANATGRRDVIFSNEAGASAATRIVQGQEVNHQYSKSFAFEGLLRTAFASLLGDKISYVSLLRPVSELWIAKRLARAPQRLATFASCNRNFVSTVSIEEAQRVKWCGTCDKCLFTALILAPHLTPERHFEIFGHKMLDDPQYTDMARELVGLGNQKPWECVGDVDDTRLVAQVLSKDPAWKDKAVIKNLASEIEANTKARTAFETRLKARGESYLPTALRAALT
ncbi:MAG: hypothetical protein AAGD04_07040 [Pseudomonadota bacterium]